MKLDSTIMPSMARWAWRGLVAVVIAVVLINAFVIIQGVWQTYTIAQLNERDLENNAPVLVLGAGVIDNRTPSQILQLRLDAAYALYQSQPKHAFIMSGDHREDNYNEVRVMKEYLVAKGMPSEQIYLDHAGYSTYDSIYRAHNVLGLDQLIIISQGYHVSRALMLARHLGIDAVGVAAHESTSTRLAREGREVLARVKDFLVCYLGYPTPPIEIGYGFDINQSGDLTNEK